MESHNQTLEVNVHLIFAQFLTVLHIQMIQNLEDFFRH